MKTLPILFFTLIQFQLFGQWTTLESSPASQRNDDLCFINDSIGWVATGSERKIFKTTDGGDSWILQYSGNTYLRSIEFATDLLGFCGSLDGQLLKTTDGGENWIDIANGIQPKPHGICGLSAPSPEVIYGCGIWSSPAFLIKSADGGVTWTYKDMSHLAKSLIDVHFISQDTGFLTGKANPETDGGIILHTTDGGETWTVLYKTMIPFDYVWKIQSPDGKNYFASIDAIPSTRNMRILKSNDFGMNWKSVIANNNYLDAQMIGFIDSLTGWVGGFPSLLESKDGGETWKFISFDGSYNRFFKVNDFLAYMSGSRIYKYSKEGTVNTIKQEMYVESHSLTVSPNPAADLINIEIDISQRTNCQLQIFSTDGLLIHNLYIGTIEKGVKKYSYNIDKIQPQTIYVTLKTNEGLVYRKVIKM